MSAYRLKGEGFFPLQTLDPAKLFSVVLRGVQRQIGRDRTAGAQQSMILSSSQGKRRAPTAADRFGKKPTTVWSRPICFWVVTEIGKGTGSAPAFLGETLTRAGCPVPTEVLTSRRSLQPAIFRTYAYDACGLERGDVVGSAQKVTTQGFS
jgi:hypothetical protein